MAKLRVDWIFIHYQGEPATVSVDPRRIGCMVVKDRKLTLTPSFEPPVGELLARAADRQSVDAVTFLYGCHRNRKSYRTTVSATVADTIVYHRSRCSCPVPVEVRNRKDVPTELLEGEVAVLTHEELADEGTGRDGDLGWHSPECTWYYPF